MIGPLGVTAVCIYCVCIYIYLHYLLQGTLKVFAWEVEKD